MSSGVPQTDAAQAAIATELGAHTAHLAELCALLRAERAEIAQLGVSNTPMASERLENFPTRGVVRLLVRRTGNGGSVTVDTAGEYIIDANVTRVGGLLVNTGTAGVTLYLADHAGAGIPQTWVSGSGGSWDFRLGDALWCGDVFAVADSGTAALSWGEV